MPPIIIGNQSTDAMEANGVKKSKELEDANAKLKKLFAEFRFENHSMKELSSKKVSSD